MLFLTRLGDLTTDDVGSMLFVLMGVMVVICVVGLVIIKSKDAENDSKPILEMKAKIIDKDKVDPGTVAFVIGVTFETEDGNRMELSCSAKEHFVVGDTGYLKWQGTRLISFERDR
ncbi:MAG: DUF2500 domain-containing protein [Oscillospiraceae bacterium]|nr:DUF2500 domain-containing protein [Oscillospiraceae bacterium]